MKAPPETELEVAVPKPAARKAIDLASLWADLLLVEMSLHERSKIPRAGSNLYLRRALWEQAVIGYGRCFNTGSREKLPADLLDTMSPAEVDTHRETLAWRNKHVAHRVEKRFEWTDVSLAYRPETDSAHAVRIRVELNEGPEGGLADALQRLAQRLRIELWEREFGDVEEMILRLHGNDESLRRQASAFQATTRTFYTIDPTGR